MSYILEALKKAQAERQLGNAPTIHAPSVHATPQAASGRKPLVIGFAAGAVLVAGALFAWRQQTPKVADAGQAAQQASVASPMAAPHAVTARQPAPMPSAAQAPAVKPPLAEASPGAQVALVQDAAGTEPETRRAQVKPVTEKPAAKVAATSPAAKPAAPPDAAPAHVPSRAEQAVAAPAPAPAVPSADENLRTLNELPDSVRLNVPRVGFGGYMYSPNPADRLVLIDRILRREGEEVAPGLVLEKVLPKAAVMNYRGNRYRVPL